MTWELHHHDARRVSELLEPESVDLIVTSPPYWNLRDYRDGGESYEGQMGSEPTPSQFLDDLVAATEDWLRVLKPTGSIFVNLGDAMSKGQRFDHGFTSQDAAWLAGVIDSDGSISIRVDNGGRSHVAWTRVGQMREEVVRRIGEVTGVGQVWQDKRGVWNWNAAAQQARWVLERIWPWLRIKQPQALAAIDLMAQKAAGGRKGKWNQLTDDDLSRREKIRQAVLAWNRNELVDWYEPPAASLPDLPTDPRFIPAKSLLGLPWRYALRCIDELGLILRAEVIWSKPNGLPESVTDRVRRSHEQWFHFTRQGRYFAAIDEVREAYPAATIARYEAEYVKGGLKVKTDHAPDWLDDRVAGPTKIDANPLGKVPGSVWSIPSEPLVVPEALGVDHFAAFPSELPRRIILGWSPSGYCTVCDEPRRPVVHKTNTLAQATNNAYRTQGQVAGRGGVAEFERMEQTTKIVGYLCAPDCPAEAHAPTRPAVVLDPFAGTGTTVAVAHLLGRHGIGTDLSRDYLRLAEWRCTSDRRLRDKVLDRTGIPNPDPPAIDGQLDLFEGIA